MAKFNETSQESSLCVPLQKYNKGSWLINNNNNKMADFLFCFKKHLKLPVQIQWRLILLSCLIFVKRACWELNLVATMAVPC